jgi:hypothetical protein
MVRVLPLGGFSKAELLELMVLVEVGAAEVLVLELVVEVLSS